MWISALTTPGSNAKGDGSVSTDTHNEIRLWRVVSPLLYVGKRAHPPRVSLKKCYASTFDKVPLAEPLSSRRLFLQGMLFSENGNT